MLYLIGLGLDKDDISLKALEAIKKCHKIYLEIYTTTFPYPVSELEKIIKKKVIEAPRNLVESDFLVKEAKKQDVALLIYGDPLLATTHLSLISEAKKAKVRAQVVHNASIINAVSETGLHLYKFGKIASIPKWQEGYKPLSFYDIVKENQSINAHTLLLVDLGLSSKEALSELEEASHNELKDKEIIILSKAGTNEQKIFHDKLHELLKNKKIQAKISEPFCIIVPGSLHFTETEFFVVKTKS